MDIISYKKLWKLLIDLDIKKKDLQQAAGVSSALIAKMGRNENVSTDSLVKICTALNCDIGDIIEIVPTVRGFFAPFPGGTGHCLVSSFRCRSLVPFLSFRGAEQRRIFPPGVARSLDKLGMTRGARNERGRGDAGRNVTETGDARHGQHCARDKTRLAGGAWKNARTEVRAFADAGIQLA